MVTEITNSNLNNLIQKREEDRMAEKGYCVKCKSKKEMKDTKKVTMKNGRSALKGSCTDCNTGMYKILKIS